MNTCNKTNLTVLFVDDEANILSSLKRELREWSRNNAITIDTAGSGEEALGKISALPEQYAIVVSDLRMPVMKGSDLIIAIHEKWPDIVALLLSGYSELEEVMKAVKAGAFSYLLKPWDTGYLCKELDKALETFRIRAENRQYQARILDDLKWAGEMQKALLRPVPMHSEGIEFRSSYLPVPGFFCGGDYYDVINLAKDRYLLLMGDVSGHGVRGALVTAMLKSIIYTDYVSTHRGHAFSPADFLAWLNTRMNTQLQQASGMLIAFAALVIDRSAMTLTYANAGLPHPFILRGHTLVELPVSGSAIGFASSVLYRDILEPILPVDTVLIFTDGLTEIQSPNQTCLDINMKNLLASLEPGPELHKRIMQKALHEAGASGFSDDVTMLTAKIL